MCLEVLSSFSEKDLQNKQIAENFFVYRGARCGSLLQPFRETPSLRTRRPGVRIPPGAP
jgi:hypothetical protein